MIILYKTSEVGIVKPIGQTKAQIEFYNLEFDSSPAVGSQAGGRGRQICNGFFENSSYSGSRVYISLLESWSTVGALSR